MGSLTAKAEALLDRVADEATKEVDLEFLRGGTILVTGATGLVGGAFCHALLRADAARGLGLSLILPSRNPAKAVAAFPGTKTHIVALPWNDLLKPLSAPRADFAIHAAAPTASVDMARRPEDTLLAVFDGTRNFLDWARGAGVRKAVFLSSLEVYGRPPDGKPDVTEVDSGTLDPARCRSSYAEGKRAAETLCTAYAAQSGVPVCSARLAQTFGPGAAWDDRRLFGDFARNAVCGRNIVLHTAGRTARNYCHLSDAVSALLVLLRAGVAGEAYNVAREDSFITVRNLAELFLARDGLSGCVAFDGAGETAHGYAPEMQIRLLTAKLESLGWRARLDLARMVDDLLEWYREIRPLSQEGAK